MKGLLIKDYCLMFRQKTSVILMLVFGCMFTLCNEDPTMGICYSLFVLSSLIMGTQSYDEYDHGMTYLVTLPAGRKGYVREKYIFLLLNTVVLWMFFVLFSLGAGAYRGMLGTKGYIPELLGVSLICLFVCHLFHFVMVPTQLKVGAEKARWVLLLMMGGCFVLFFLLMAMLDRVRAVVDKLHFLQNVTLPGMVGCVAALWLVGLILSYRLSQRILQQKEY